MTRESHAWWRYAAQVDGRPDLSTEDELLLNRDEEATRVATTTERLIRTQAAHPREFHRVLDDGAAIAEAIADLDVQRHARLFRPRGPPPSKGMFRFFYSTARRGLCGRADVDDCARQSGHSTAVPRLRVASPSAHAVAASSCTQAAWN